MTLGDGLGMLRAMQVAKLSVRCWGLALVLALAQLGCAGGTETGNPSLTGELSYTGVSSAPADIGVRSGGDVATVDNAWFALDRVTVSSAGDCAIADGNAFSIGALGIGDHAAGVHNASEFQAESGTFCSVELPFLRVASDDQQAPDELRGHGVAVAGHLADGTPFLIQSDAAPLVRLRGATGGFALDAQTPNALLAFDFATWLGGIDWSMAEVTAGRVDLTESSNTRLLRAFEARLASGVSLYRDEDGDGVLDASPVLLANAR